LARLRGGRIHGGLRCTYDLRKPVKDYSKIEKALQAYKVRNRFLESEWLIETDQTAEQVLATVKSAIDFTDGLVVTESTQNMAWVRANATDADMEKWKAAARK
jgi:hypothetical protein